MSTQELELFKQLIVETIREAKKDNPNVIVSSVEVTKWVEVGEYNGEDVRPVFKIEFVETKLI